MTNKALDITIEHFDLHSIYEVDGFIELYKEYADGFGIEFTPKLMDCINSRFKSGDLKLIYAQVEGKLVGFVVYRADHPPLSVSNCIALEDIMVDKNHRGRGIADALLKELVSHARSISAGSIRFITQKSNTTVNKLMLSNGAIYTDWEHGAILTLVGE